ncbi:MAG: type II secretion system protein [Fusobacteriaceae bacterium]|nr:type II secretion system protein [Fusobacteriaceae bacterium]MBN2838171.1 type II secretion system protein [Fusobacteriaceae bacterium]
MKNLKKGFTLIELMIVVAIIAILAVVAAPKFGQQLKKAKDSRAVSLLGTYRSALTMHAADNEAVYATSFSAIGTYVDDKTVTTTFDSTSGQTPYTTLAGVGDEAGAQVGTSTVHATPKPWVVMKIDGTVTETSISIIGSGNDTKGTSWASY